MLMQLFALKLIWNVVALTFGRCMEICQLFVLAFENPPLGVSTDKECYKSFYWQQLHSSLSLMLVRKTKDFSLDIPQVLFSFSSSTTSFTGLGLTGQFIVVKDVCGPDWENTFHVKVTGPRMCLCVRAVNRAAFLSSVSTALCNRHRDGSPGDASLCWACPLRCRIRAPPLATLGSGTSLSFGHTCFAHRWQETGDGAGRLCLHMQALGGLTHT